MSFPSRPFLASNETCPYNSSKRSGQQPGIWPHSSTPVAAQLPRRLLVHFGGHFGAQQLASPWNCLQSFGQKPIRAASTHFAGHFEQHFGLLYCSHLGKQSPSAADFMQSSGQGGAVVVLAVVVVAVGGAILSAGGFDGVTFFVGGVVVFFVLGVVVFFVGGVVVFFVGGVVVICFCGFFFSSASGATSLQHFGSPLNGLHSLGH